MNRQYHFIAGLPRSGSTLLSVILNQNPIFQSSMSGPVYNMTQSMIEIFSGESKHHYSIDVKKNIIRGIFDNYYYDNSKVVCFDTNRGWSSITYMISELYPHSKIILCVRDVALILDSFERIIRRNPFIKSKMFSNEFSSTVYSRCDCMMQNGGVVGFPYKAISQAISSEESSNLFIVEYERLCKNPLEMMKELYNFIDQPMFDHDFNNVSFSYDEFDDNLNTPGLHTTRKTVEWVERAPILPPDILMNYSMMHVWRQLPQFNNIS